jgi:TrkA domain protein
MSIDLRETRLPGVGVKYTFRTSGGSRVVVVQHNDGDREIYTFRHARDDEPASVLALDDEEARQLGAVLAGAYARPKIVEDLAMALGELTIEWLPVPDQSPLIGRTLRDIGFRGRTGVTIIAILRDPEPISGAQPEDVVQHGDVLVTVGKASAYQGFRRLLATGEV